MVDLYRLQPDTEHPHGLSDRDFDSLFTKDKPVIFNFHGYPWLIHKFTYRRTNHANIHVRGYKEKGNINTPLELAIRNQVDRFNLAIDVIDRVPKLQGPGAQLKEWLKGQIIESINYAYTEGIRTNPRSGTGSGRRRIGTTAGVFSDDHTRFGEGNGAFNQDGRDTRLHSRGAQDGARPRPKRISEHSCFSRCPRCRPQGRRRVCCNL